MSSNSTTINPFASIIADNVTLLCTIAGIAEFMVYLPTVPLFLFGLALLYPTAILHRNLKAILLVQFTYVILFSTCRLITLVGEFVEKDIFWYPPTFFVGAVGVLIMFGNLCGHALMVERIVATRMVQRYEQYRNWDFTVAWLCTAVLLCAAINYYQIYVLGSLVQFNDLYVAIYVGAMAASFAEIFLLSYLTRFNQRRFATRQSGADRNAQLTVRYQLTENIRTGRQLGPNMLFHFIAVVLSFSLTIIVRFSLVTDLQILALVTSFAFLTHASLNLLMMVTTILFHPVLKRKAKRVLALLLRGLVFLPRVQNMVSPTDLDVCPLPTDANGRVLVGGGTQSPAVAAQSDTYFKQLVNAWGDK